MLLFWVSFTSREEQREVLIKLIESLSISKEEKDLYLFSMDILDDADFLAFFEKITQEVYNHSNINLSFVPITP